MQRAKRVRWCPVQLCVSSTRSRRYAYSQLLMWMSVGAPLHPCVSSTGIRSGGQETTVWVTEFLLAAEGPRRGLARAHRSLAGALVTGHVRAVPASAPLHSCVSFDKFQEWRPERDRNDGIGIGIDNRSLRAAEGTLGDTLPGGLPMYEQARPRRAGVGDRYTTRLRKTTEPSSS